MHPQWARDIRDQCSAAGAAFFFKQWGEYAPVTEPFDGQAVISGDAKRTGFMHLDGRLLNHVDGQAVLMHRYGKKAAGHELDGREWKEFPSRRDEERLR